MTDHPLTAAELDEIRRVTRAVSVGLGSWTSLDPDAKDAFIALARTAVPRLLRELEEARALLTQALVVAGNAAAHWHVIEGATMEPGECPGCAAETESKAALDQIRAYLARAGAKEPTNP